MWKLNYEKLWSYMKMENKRTMREVMTMKNNKNETR